MKINYLQEPVIIKTLLQTLKAKSQNTEIGTTIYGN